MDVEEAMGVGVGDDVGVEVGRMTAVAVDVIVTVAGDGSGAVGVGIGVSGGSGVVVGAAVGGTSGTTGADSAPQIVSKTRAGGGAEPSPHTQPSTSPLPTVHVAAPIPEYVHEPSPLRWK
jgi:hypothetical protein